MQDPGLGNQNTGMGGNSIEGEKFTGGEKLVGLAALLSELKDNLQGLLTNPATSGYGLYRLGKYIDDYFTKRIKEGNKATKEQLDLFAKYSGSEKIFLTIVAAIGAATLRTVALTGELRRAGTEFGRFANLSQLPGGVAGAPSVIGGIQQRALTYNQSQLGLPTGGNEAFRQAYQQNYQQLYRLMQYYKIPSSDRNETAATLARYQITQGLQGGEMISQLMSNYSGRGLTFQTARKILDMLAYAPNVPESPFGPSSSPELQEAFSTIMPSLVRNTVTPTLAAEQTFRLFGALGRQGAGVKGQPLGYAEMMQMGMIPGAVEGMLEKNVALQQLTGISPSKFTGPGGAVGILGALQQFIQSKTGGKQITNAANLKEISPEAYGFLQGMESLYGVNKEMGVMLNNMPKITQDADNLSSAFVKATESSKDWSGTFSDSLKRFNKDLQDSIANSQGGLEFLEATGRKVMLNISQQLVKSGYSQTLLDITTALGGAGLQILTGALPYILANSMLLKGMKSSGITAGGAGLEEGLLAGGILGGGKLGKLGKLITIPRMISAAMLINETGRIYKQVQSGQHLGATGVAEDVLDVSAETLPMAFGLPGLAGTGAYFGAKAIMPWLLRAITPGADLLYGNPEEQKKKFLEKAVTSFMAGHGSWDKKTNKYVPAPQTLLPEAQKWAEQEYETTRTPAGAVGKEEVPPNEALVTVQFTNEAGQDLGKVTAMRGSQNIIRIFSSGVLSTATGGY